MSDLTINPFFTWKVSNYHSQEKLPSGDLDSRIIATRLIGGGRREEQALATANLNF